MSRAEWGADPEFFGPRHAYREALIRRRLPASDRGFHLECAAGVGSLSISVARTGRPTVAADRSLRSLAVICSRLGELELPAPVLPVVADIGRLPFRSQTFATVTTAETLEHIGDDTSAAAELARVLERGGTLVGTVPAGPAQWSPWDDWAGHLRRYTPEGMRRLLAAAGLEPSVTTWGWPLVRLYDDLFLKRVNRRRLESAGPVAADPALRKVASLGRHRWLVRLVCLVFSVDRLFAGARGGVGLLFEAVKPAVENHDLERVAGQSGASPTHP